MTRIHGPAFASAVQNGDTYFTIFVDGDLMELEGNEGALKSPNPALLQVYPSKGAFIDYDNDAPIARRVCYPPSIQVDGSNFGLG